ncbi:class I adenylate-forming enzyme family protein [Roseibium sp. M-1]
MAFVGDSLAHSAKRFPGRAALACGPVRFSWAGFAERVGTIEAGLLCRTQRGGRVVLRLADPASLLICFFACARTGRIAVVMDPGWPPAQTDAVLAGIAPNLVVDEHIFAELSNGDDLSSDGSTGGQEPPGEADFFYAGFTSGSSGMPKGYVRSHGSWLESFALSEHVFGISPQSRVVLPGQLTHSLHLYGAVCGLASGQEVVLMPRFDPRAVLAALEDAPEGSVLYATPTQLHFLAEAARRTGPVAAVRQVLASGAKWRDADRQAMKAVFPEAKLFEFYGASETSFITVSSAEEDGPAGSVGRAAAGVEIVIGDPHAPAPAGKAGLIWVRSGLLFDHYLCGAAPDTLWKDGWLTVGDHGFLDAAGFLVLTGRENRMVVTSGLNVYPEEVEAVLMDHSAVALAVVVGLADAVRGQRLEAAVELSASLDNPEIQLLRRCREHLASGKVPKKIHILQELPLTAGGKPDIQKIAAELAGGGKKR